MYCAGFFTYEATFGKAHACMHAWCRVQEAAEQARASAGARLIRLELLASRQAAALAGAERQIAKLNTRARALGRDLQPPLRQVSASLACNVISRHCLIIRRFVGASCL